MKKNILKIAVVTIIAISGGIGVYQAQMVHKLDQLTIANIEALADNEEAETIYCCTNSGTCVTIITPTGSVANIAGVKFFSPCANR